MEEENRKIRGQLIREYNKTQCSTWDITVNKQDNLDKDGLIKSLREHCKHWAFQLEMGHETKRPHFQIRLRFGRKITPPGIRSKIGLLVGAFFTPTSTRVASTKNFDYVLKSDTRVDGPWTDKDPVPKEPLWDVEEYKDKLLPFQQQIKDTCLLNKDKKTYDRRTINCIVDPVGCVGKTIIRRIATFEGWATYLPVVDTVVQLIGYAKNYPSSAYILDLPRALDKKNIIRFLAGIENIKDGDLTEVRYSGSITQINPPAVWVMTNVYPDLSLLSPDRWKIWQVNDEKKLVECPPPKKGGKAKKRKRSEDDTITA